MDFNPESLPAGAAWVAGLIVFAALWFDWRRTNWRGLLEGPVANRLFAATVALMLLWNLHAGLKPGHRLHLLGVTAAVLTFGRGRALAALTVASLAALLVHRVPLSAWPFNFAVMAVLPAWITSAADRVIQRRLPNNFFVFLFLNTCAVAVAGVLAVGGGATLTFVLGGAELAPLLADYLPYFLLLSFAEAWISGMLITVMVVWLPGWVASFDDRRYLTKQ